MWKLLGTIMAASLCCLATMTPLTAGIFCNGACFGPCAHCNPHPCHVCHVNPCRCVAPVAAVPRTIIQSRTVMQPQTIAVPTTTYRDVVRTEIRTQAELQSVPVTRFKTVIADEGGWQQVWVSRLVQKQIPETVIEQRTVCKEVPYQVTQRIPETTYTTATQWVPRTIQQQVSVAQPPCSVCGPGATSSPTVSWSASPAPMIGAIPQAYPASPSYATTIGRELQPLRSTAIESRTATNAPSDLAPVPDPQFLDTPRSAYRDWSPVTTTRPSEPVRTSSAAGRFVPVPGGASATRIR